MAKMIGPGLMEPHGIIQAGNLVNQMTKTKMRILLDCIIGQAIGMISLKTGNGLLYVNTINLLQIIYGSEFSTTILREAFFSNQDDDALSKNVDDPNAQLYSILGQLEDYRSGGRFHFRLCYPELVGVNGGDGCNEWTQTSNPATESTITGFQPISLSFLYNSYLENWVGIGKDISGVGATFISDAPNRQWWWTAIGSYTYHESSSTIPGPRNLTNDQYIVKQVELYVKL